MHHAARTYGAVAKQTANPRELEADLLLDAAARLQAVRDGWENRSAELEAALTNNRKLWSILLSAVTSDESPQSIEIRQNIANIGTFVLSQTAEMQIAPKPELLKPLIEINCNLAAGLSGRA